MLQRRLSHFAKAQLSKFRVNSFALQFFLSKEREWMIE
jgi:hypothetical protein